MRRIVALLLLAAASTAGAQGTDSTAQTGTVDPGMSRAQVVARLGRPTAERTAGQYTYLFYRNGCVRTCGMDDLVVLQHDAVVDAVFRSPNRHYSGPSSSPTALAPSQAHARREPVLSAAPADSVAPAAAASPASPATPAAAAATQAVETAPAATGVPGAAPAVSAAPSSPAPTAAPAAASAPAADSGAMHARPAVTSVEVLPAAGRPAVVIPPEPAAPAAVDTARDASAAARAAAAAVAAIHSTPAAAGTAPPAAPDSARHAAPPSDSTRKPPEG